MSHGKTGEYCPQNMDKKVSSFSLLESWTLLSTLSRYFSLEEKRLFFRRRNLKIIFFLVFLTKTTRPLLFFDHQPHSYTVGEKNSPSPSPCDYAVRGFALRIICNLKLVKIWKNTTKAINEISLYNRDWFDNRVDYKPKLKFPYILAENHQRHVLTKFH